MKGQIALITGANKGIGFETARQLGKLGTTVLIGARDKCRGETAVSDLKRQEIDAHVVQLNVTDASSCHEAAKFIETKFGVLDILVNNAGIIKRDEDSLPGGTSLNAIRETFDTNFFGLIAITQALLPLLQKSKAGRIVNLSSILGSIAEHSDPNLTIYQAKYTAYDCSKAALNMFTNHLAYELRGTKIKVNAVHPGWVKTDMGGEMAPMDLTDGATTSVRFATLGEDGPTGGFYHKDVHMRW